MPAHRKPDEARLDRIVAEARQNRDKRMQGYREQALRIHPWICTRCAREFDRTNLSQLTVHHRDGNHDNNPPDGSNWELLCIYCHENEHARVEDHKAGGSKEADPAPATHKPLAGLADKLRATASPARENAGTARGTPRRRSPRS